MGADLSPEEKGLYLGSVVQFRARSETLFGSRRKVGFGLKIKITA